MDYAVERDGGGTKILLENGDSILVKIVVGEITSNGTTPNGKRDYNVQYHVALFVSEKPKELV